MLREKGFTKVGLAIVTEKDVHLLEYRKMSYAGFKASKTKGKKIERSAGRKSWATRRENM
jgi:hypothetical protein